MAAASRPKTLGWQRIDNAAVGIIYGAIMVLSILVAQGNHHEAALETAIVLFGSVLAITLAKTFAEIMAYSLDTGRRATRHALREAWSHGSPILAVANVPTLLFLAAALGWMSASLAIIVSQGVCVTLLVLLGARTGWVVDRRVVPAILGGLFTGGIGVALALLKQVVH